MLRQLRIDPARTHFLGKLAYADYLKVLQVSAAHVYLTYPFVLSWSLLESAVLGCPLVASDTAPVREFVVPAKRVRLVDFFDVDRIAAAVLEFLEQIGEGDSVARGRRQLRERVSVRDEEYGNFLLENMRTVLNRFPLETMKSMAGMV